jgi:hypothetical protein
MLVSDNLYKLEVTVECRGSVCNGTKSSEELIQYTVPADSDIKIGIVNMGEKTIQLTARTKNTTWELLKGSSLKTVCSQEHGENGIAFGNGHFNLVLEFVH